MFAEENVQKIDKIICNFNMFDIEQTIYIYTDNSTSPIAKCSMDELGKTITDICFGSNIANVHLFGNAKYVENILHDIDLHSGCSAYSNGMIKVEVN